MAKDSAGLRIRSHPSLQSEQIGIVKVNGTITFIDEVICKETLGNKFWTESFLHYLYTNKVTKFSASMF